MKKHTKLYLKFFGFDESDFIPCEICGCLAVDIHHIDARGMGGTKKADTIDNLMALCREHHMEFGDKKQHKEYLKNTHDFYIQLRKFGKL
jgi:hypothetical protein